VSKSKTAKRQVRLPGSERKQIILEKAITLFASRGFHGVSIEEIAAAAKITKPVLYDHFSSKYSLYIEVTKAIRGRLLAAGRDTMMLSQTFPARVRAGVEGFFRFADDNPAAIRILLSPPRVEKRLYSAVQTIQDEATAAIMKMILAAGLEMPSAGPGRIELKIQVEFIKRGLHALAEWRTQHGAIPRDLVVEAVTKLICSGLLFHKQLSSKDPSTLLSVSKSDHTLRRHAPSVLGACPKLRPTDGWSLQ
jgi:AcrR family transcriptional regulator